MGLTIPIVVWGSSPPLQNITSLYMTNNCKFIFTGNQDGHICVWGLENGKLEPKYIFIGHKANVLCMLSINEDSVISCSEDGVMSTWAVEDGHSTNIVKLQYVHKNIQLFQKSESESLLFCCGYYSDIVIINPITLELVSKLYSIVDSNWISCFHVQKSIEPTHDVVFGLSITGSIKSWSLKKNERDADSIYECESKKLHCLNALNLKFHSREKWILIVCQEHWEIYDTNFFTCLCSNSCSPSEYYLGGDFYAENKIIVWTENGNAFIYCLFVEDKIFKYDLAKTYTIPKSCVTDRNILYFNPLQSHIFVSGDSKGNISLLNLEESNTLPNMSNLEEFWNNGPTFELLEYICVDSPIHSSIYIPALDRIAFGLLDGTVVVACAVQMMKKCFFNLNPVNYIPHLFLCQHTDKVNSLIYPYQSNETYDKSHLVSASSDFSVCLWNINTGNLIHRFCAHGGEVIQLIIPPRQCKLRVQRCVCSVGRDHTVALLSLTEKKCIVLAANHVFPVFNIYWKPLDDFLIVECSDGTIYVWEMETGCLDRTLFGVIAQDVLNSCNELNDTENYSYSSPFVHAVRSIMNKNVNEVLNATQRGLSQIQMLVSNEKNNDIVPLRPAPLIIQDLNINESKRVGHVFYFEIESIISDFYEKFNVNNEKNLDLFGLRDYENFEICTVNNSFDMVRTVSTVIERVKIQTENMHAKLQMKDSVREKERVKKAVYKQAQNNDLTKDITHNIVHILFSLICTWDSELPTDIQQKLGLLLSTCSLVSGILSKNGNLSLYLPTKHNIKQFLTLNPGLTSNYKSTIKALVNMLGDLKTNSFHSSQGQLIEKQDWRFVDAKMQLRKKVELLALNWQSNCIEIRNVVHRILTKELNEIGHIERYKLLKYWFHFLPTPQSVLVNQYKHLELHVVVNNIHKTDAQIISLVVVGLILAEFGTENYSTDEAHNIEKVTLFYTELLQWILFNLPSYNMSLTKMRRIAIDMIGYGFQKWEAYFDLNKLLLCLFECCYKMGNIIPTCPTLSPKFDLCYTSHKTLLKIAFKRTPSFINSLLEEINNIKVNQYQNAVIEKAKPEILFIVNKILKQSNEWIQDFLLQIVDITLFCIDSNQLKTRNVTSIVPNINKYDQIQHIVDLNKIVVGLKNGSVSVFELKNLKYNLNPAHKEKVSCVQFSSDGKILATYSYDENCLSFWQVSTTIFGFGNIQIKLLRSYENCCKKSTNECDFGKLRWNSNKSVILLFQNGTEFRFNI